MSFLYLHPVYFDFELDGDKIYNNIIIMSKNG